MPANKGITPDWNPKPDFMSQLGIEIRPDTSVQRKKPKTVKACAKFFLKVGFPDLDCYLGDKKTQKAIAKEAAKQIYKPGKRILPLMEKYVTLQNSPETQLAIDNQRELVLMKVERQLAERPKISIPEPELPSVPTIYIVCQTPLSA